MGMFDEIHFNGNWYQTKDFDCVLCKYWIENGRLIKGIGYHVDVPKEQRPYPDAPEDSILSACGMVRWVETERKDTRFHGVLNFYRLDENQLWEEYNAKFTDGTIVEMNRVEPRAEPSVKPITESK